MTPSPLFENAIDSLELAIHFLLESERRSAQKHAVLGSFHAVELLLKERLHQEHPLLVFERVGGRVDDADARTVGVKEAYARLRNAGVELDKQDWNSLVSLQRHRNRIEHRHFDPDPEHDLLTRKALSFAFRFIRDHLKEDLSEHLDEDSYEAVRQEVLTYEHLLEDANKRLKELGAEGSAATCPYCGEDTLVLDMDGLFGNAHCAFCSAGAEVEECQKCGQHVVIESLDGWNMCEDCVDYMISQS